VLTNDEFRAGEVSPGDLRAVCLSLVRHSREH